MNERQKAQAFDRLMAIIESTDDEGDVDLRDSTFLKIKNSRQKDLSGDWIWQMSRPKIAMGRKD